MGSHSISGTPPAPSPRREARDVLESLRRLVRFLRLAGRRSESSHGLSAAQLFVLQSLARAPARSLAELAERTLTDQSSVSIVVARLVERGLLVRRRSRADLRRTELALSSRGRAIAARGPDLAQVRIVNAVTRMPPSDRRALVAALDALVRALGADAIAPRMLFEDESPRPGRPSRRRKGR